MIKWHQLSSSLVVLEQTEDTIEVLGRFHIINVMAKDGYPDQIFYIFESEQVYQHPELGVALDGREVDFDRIKKAMAQHYITQSKETFKSDIPGDYNAQGWGDFADFEFKELKTPFENPPVVSMVNGSQTWSTFVDPMDELMRGLFGLQGRGAYLMIVTMKKGDK